MSSRILGARRGLALSASVLIGLGAAVALPATAGAQRPGGYHSAVSGAATCDVAANEWVVDWTITSTAPPVIRAWRLVEVVTDPPGSTLTGIATSDDYERITDLVGVQRLPGTATSAALGVRAEWSDGFQEEELRWGTLTFDDICGTVPPGPVTVAQDDHCDQLVVQVNNPEDGVAAEVLVTTADGGHELRLLAPGESWTVEFPASDGLTYEVSVAGTVIASGGWQAPEDCDQAGPPGEDDGDGGDNGGGDDGAGGGLPVTGGQTGAVIGAALALLAVGGGLFWLARRRRVTFSA